MKTNLSILTVAALAAGLSAQAQTPVVMGVFNSASSGVPLPAIAPGELMSVTGQNLGDAGQVSCGSATGFTATCGGVSVTIGGTAAAVRSESATVAIIQASFGLTPGTYPLVLKRVAGGQTLQSAPFMVAVAATAPQLYTSPVNNVPFASCVDSTGKSITLSNPAISGTHVQCPGSGFGVTNPVVTAGAIPPTPLPSVVAPVTVSLGGTDAKVISTTLGTSNTPVGVYLLTFEVPQGVGPGVAPLIVSVGGNDAQLVMLIVGNLGPSVQSVVNSASNAVAGLPNAGVAPGSILVAYGTLLGPASLVTAPGYPWPANLSGTSAQVTVGGKTASVLLYYTSSNQIAGLLPSSTPVGTGTITVTYNGQAGTPAPITVAANNFGVYTVPQNGSGPGIVTFADYSVVGQSKAANPGETLIVWGTGLGAVSGDEADGPLPGDMPNLPVQVWVGGAAANVVYRGRSGCCVGEDQIAFVVPSNVTGCLVPLAVQINNQISNFSTIAVTPTGRACVPAYNTVPAGVTSAAQPRAAYVQFTRTLYPPSTAAGAPGSSDSATARFVQLGETISSFNISLDGPSFGSCLVASSLGAQNPGILARLDAGVTLTASGAGGSRTLTEAAGGGVYSGQIGNGTAGNFLDPGSFSFTGTGGTNVGPFATSFQIPAFTWTNQPASNTVPAIPRASGTTVKWSGGDPNGNVQISGSATSGNGVTLAFLCQAHTADGSFTVPAWVLQALPASTQGALTVSSNPAGSTFSATGLDAGILLTQWSSTSYVAFQ